MAPSNTCFAFSPRRAGISPEYHDIAGTLHVTSDDTTRAICLRWGFASIARGAGLAAWDEADRQQPCDPILILQQGYEGVQWSLRLLLEQGDEHRCLLVAWHLTSEKGTVIHRAEAVRAWFRRRNEI